MEKAKVYFTKEITADSLVRIYEALGHTLPGKVAVKISTGESEKSNNLRPELIAPLVQKLNGTIVECCTAYGGNRQNIRKHWAEIEKRGYKEVLDEFHLLLQEVTLPKVTEVGSVWVDPRPCRS